MQTWLRRAGVAALGILFVLVCCEAALHLLGAWHDAAAHSSAPPHRGSHYRIVCVGDSFTVGGGAPPGQDYPHHLERLLSGASNRLYFVQNAGISGNNSAQILARLPTLMDDLDPDLIVLLAGGANYWNRWGHSAAPPGSHAATFNKLLYRIRLFKLVQLLYFNIAERRAADRVTAAEIKAVADARARLSVATNDAYACYVIGMDRYRHGDEDAALSRFERGIACDPRNTTNHLMAATLHFYHGNLSQGWEHMRAGIAIDPLHWELYEVPGYIPACLYLGTNTPETVTHLQFPQQALAALAGTSNLSLRQLTALLHSLPPASDDSGALSEYMTGFAHLATAPDAHVTALRPPDLSALPPALAAQETARAHFEWYSLALRSIRGVITADLAWTRYDLTRIADLCRERGVSLLLLTYPIAPKPAAHAFNATYVNQIIRAVAREKQIPLLDLDQEFCRLGDAKRRFFVPGIDVHPNADGYRLMARLLYERLADSQHGVCPRPGPASAAALRLAGAWQVAFHAAQPPPAPGTIVLRSQDAGSVAELACLPHQAPGASMILASHSYASKFPHLHTGRSRSPAAPPACRQCPMQTVYSCSETAAPPSSRARPAPRPHPEHGGLVCQIFLTPMSIGTRAR